MMIACLVFNQNFQSGKIVWQNISKLMKSDLVNVFNFKEDKLSKDEVSRRITNHFQVEFDDYEIDLGYIANNHIYILYINNINTESCEKILHPLFELPSFLQARIYDDEYNLWQNMDDITYYEASGREHSNLPKINNGLPFPLEATVIDISSNPGRYIFRDGYIEFISALMWFNKSLLEKLNSNLEELKKQDFVTFNDYNSYIEIKANDKAFVENDGTENKQILLRKFVYPKTS